MIKFISSIALVLLTAYVAHLYANQTPWWIFALGAFFSGWLVPQPAFRSWLAGFLGLFLLWFFLAWQANAANEGLLAKKMASILQLNGSDTLLIIITALIGGLVAGFAAITGAFLRKPAPFT